MFRKIKEKFRKIPTPFRQVLFVLLIIILSPVIILLGLELLMQTFHLPYKIDSYLTKKSYSRDVSVTFVYKGEEYKINSNVKCVNKGVKINENSMEWYTNWDEKITNDRIVLNDNTKAVFQFMGVQTDAFNKVFPKMRSKRAGSFCDAVLAASQEEINLLMAESKKSSIRLWFKNMNEQEINKLLLTKKYANFDFNLVRITDLDNVFNDLDLKITSLFFGEIKKLPTKFFNSYFDD